MLDEHLFSLSEYKEGVWSKIFSNRQKHTDLIINLTEKDSKEHFVKNRKSIAVFVYWIFDMECLFSHIG